MVAFADFDDLAMPSGDDAKKADEVRVSILCMLVCVNITNPLNSTLLQFCTAFFICTELPPLEQGNNDLT